MSDDLEFIVIDDIPEYVFCIGDDEENERVIALSGKDGAFKYEKVAELPTTGEDGVLYLVPKSHTTQTASGNPITATVAEEAGAIESFQLDGDTYQQSYSGKNIINYVDNLISSGGGITNTINSDGTITTVGKPNGDYNKIIEYYDLTPYLEDGATYSLSSTLYDRKTAAQVRRTKISDSSTYNYDTLGSAKTFTVDKSQYTYRMGILTNTRSAWGDESLTITKGYQLEKSATATSFEPYVGGQASPNPSYSQPIQTVTGEQTVSINDTDYSIDLGSIELCKFGNYQDYIYKDGSDWKVHKATVSAIIDGSENWETFGTNTLYVANIYSKIGNSIQSVSAGAMYASHFTIADIKGSNSLVGACLLVDTAQNISNLRIRLQDMSGGTEGFKQMLSAKKPSIYARRLTPTDTAITDTALIAQLEAVRTAALSTGSNTISNTATGTNLAGDLELGYYGYDPLNKYDKYFWLDVDGAYESL